MEEVVMKDEVDALRKQLHDLQDELALERERRLELEWDLYASQVRCADALDALASLKASREVRLGERGRSLLGKIKKGSA
jgi:hypothetical protein